MRSDHSKSYGVPGELACKDVVSRLIGAIGRKLTAYVGGARDVREVDRWLANQAISEDQERRFRLALQVIDILLKKEPPMIVQSWMIGLNPELGYHVPLRLLREEPAEAIAADLVAAAQIMAIHG